MSRSRLAYAVALLGILITTGGCAGSATAPEAASVDGFAAARVVRDSIPQPTGGPGDVQTTSAGLLNGGGRAADAP